MNQEIERKFLVKGDFEQAVTCKKRIVQGYICAEEARTVRVRIQGDECFLTIKSASNERGWSRYEFEQQITPADAEELIKLCLPGMIDKVRHWIQVGNHTWEVDVFQGDNQGLIMAEIELSSEEETFELPTWAGEEVTGDPRYYNAMLSQNPFCRDAMHCVSTGLIMKHIRIDYYTGTGGSELVARLLADKLKNENRTVEINRISRDRIADAQSIEADYYILIFPVHSFNAPQPIYEWVAHLTGKDCKTAVISVSGGGNVLSNTACRCKTVRLLKKNRFNVVYEEMVRMPNNWIKAPKEKECTRILSKLPTKIDTIAQTVIIEKRSKKIIYWIDYLISALGEAEKKGTRPFGSGIKVLDTCTGCGLCAKNCCSSNIQIARQAQAKPIFGNRCDMCLGCVYNCPQKALQPTYGAFQIDKNGYDLRDMCQKTALLQAYNNNITY